MENSVTRKILTLLVTALAVLLILFAAFLLFRKEGWKGVDTEGTETVTQTASEKVSVASGQAGEDETLAETSGELSDDGYSAPGFDTAITPYFEKGSRETLARFAADYDCSVPFCQDGDDDSLFEGYLRTGPTLEKPRHGMSSASYVVWLFRNTFGSCGEEFLDIPKMYAEGEKVTASELQPGDIGMYGTSGTEGNHFGVCIGFYDGHPLFSHCSSVPHGGYEWGCNRISYLRCEHDAYFRGSEPVDFRYFVRPDITWVD